MPPDPVPEDVRRNVRAWHDEAGDRWLESVPATVDRLTDVWELRETGPPFDGGTHSYVVPVERRDGTPAVLKVAYRDGENRAEPAGLHAYGGDGAVRLYDYDVATGAMLLERADPGTPLAAHDFGVLDAGEAARRRMAVACGLYRRLWRPVPEDAAAYPALPRACDMLAELAARFEDPPAAILGRIGRERCRRAAGLCRTLRVPVALGIANRDTHLGNIVAARREPWLLLDPKPYLAERAFDGGYFVFKQVWHGPLSAAETMRVTAARLVAEAERVAAWAALRGLDVAGEITDGDELARALGAVDAILAHTEG